MEAVVCCFASCVLLFSISLWLEKHCCPTSGIKRQTIHPLDQMAGDGILWLLLNELMLNSFLRNNVMFCWALRCTDVFIILAVNIGAYKDPNDVDYYDRLLIYIFCISYVRVIKHGLIFFKWWLVYFPHQCNVFCKMQFWWPFSCGKRFMKLYWASTYWHLFSTEDKLTSHKEKACFLQLNGYIPLRAAPGTSTKCNNVCAETANANELNTNHKRGLSRQKKGHEKWSDQAPNGNHLSSNHNTSWWC